MGEERCEEEVSQHSVPLQPRVPLGQPGRWGCPCLGIVHSSWAAMEASYTTTPCVPGSRHRGLARLMFIRCSDNTLRKAREKKINLAAYLLPLGSFNQGDTRGTPNPAHPAGVGWQELTQRTRTLFAPLSSGSCLHQLLGPMAHQGRPQALTDSPDIFGLAVN